MANMFHGVLNLTLEHDKTDIKQYQSFIGASQLLVTLVPLMYLDWLKCRQG
jgi:hypothetical protein